MCQGICLQVRLTFGTHPERPGYTAKQVGKMIVEEAERRAPASAAY